MKSNECLLAYEDNPTMPKRLLVCKHPDTARASRRLSAVWTGGRKWSKDKRALALITEGIYLVTHYGYKLDDVLRVLSEIDECRDALHHDHFWGHIL